MAPLNTIIVGVDFSPASEPALAQAMALAKHHGAALVLVHATGLTEGALAMQDEAIRTAAPWKRYVEERMAAAQDELDRAAERCRAAGIEVRSMLHHAFADASIVSAAHELDAELIVVGSHNRSGTERWLLGSVSERVVRMSERNVLVARTQSPAREAYKRLLVATDFSETAYRGLRTALMLASPEAEVDVVHCWEPPAQYGVQPPDGFVDRLRARVHEEGNALLSQQSSRVRKIRFHLVEARPASGILSRLAADDFDVAVLGSHGRRGVRRLVLGSVAEEVARAAPRSVLVVHG